MIRFLVSLLLICGLWGPDPGAAEEHLPLLTESKYFTIYAEADCDVTRLTTILDFNRAPSLESVMSQPAADVQGVLADSVDAIFNEASEILGTPVQNYKGKIMVFSSEKSMNAAFRRLYGVTLPEKGYYDFERHTVFVALDVLTLGVFSHEIAHALVSHYFVVPPPPKLQEVLAGYVEFKFRKKTGDL